MSLGQPLSFWQKPRILAVISCLMFLPYNEFCRSIGTDYIAKEKENLSLSIFFFIGIGLAWHDELDTLPAACRNCLLPATASVVTNRKVLIIVKQEVDYVALLTSSVAPTSMLTIAVRPLTTSCQACAKATLVGWWGTRCHQFTAVLFVLKQYFLISEHNHSTEDNLMFISMILVNTTVLPPRT